jgi:hypothetical protein
MRKFTAILFMIFLSFQVHAFDLVGWFARMNLSMGPNIHLGGDINDDSLYRIELTRTSDGRTFSFNYAPSEIEIWPVNFGLGLRIPVYYNKFFAAGALINMGISGSLFSSVYGAYFEYYFTDRFSFLGGLGVSSAHLTMDLGSLSDKTVSLSGTSFKGPGVVLAAKYHFFKYFFLEAGYAFVNKQGITGYTLRYGGEKIPMSGSPDQLNINTSHDIFIKIGVGI